MPQSLSRPPSVAAGQEHVQVGADLFHELSNALTVVLGSLDLLDRQPLEQDARRQLDRAQQGAERAAELAQQVFAAAQTDHARENAEVVAFVLR